MARETTMARLARLPRTTRIPRLTILTRMTRMNRPTRHAWTDRLTFLTTMDSKFRLNRQTGIYSTE